MSTLTPFLLFAFTPNPPRPGQVAKLPELQELGDEMAETEGVALARTVQELETEIAVERSR